MTGDLDRVGDVLMQRFHGVETAHLEGDWRLAQRLEVIPPTRVSSCHDESQEGLAQEKLRHQS